MSDEIQKPSLTETDPGAAESADWITNEAGEVFLSPQAIERAYQELLRIMKEQRNFQKNESPYSEEISLRKKPLDLIEPRKKLDDKAKALDTHRFPDSDRPYPYDDAYGVNFECVNFELIKERLKDLKYSEFKIMIELLDILNSRILKENTVAPSTDQQHPKTDFQSPTIPSASFEDRRLK